MSGSTGTDGVGGAIGANGVSSAVLKGAASATYIASKSDMRCFNRFSRRRQSNAATTSAAQHRAAARIPNMVGSTNGRTKTTPCVLESTPTHEPLTDDELTPHSSSAIVGDVECVTDADFDCETLVVNCADAEGEASALEVPDILPAFEPRGRGRSRARRRSAGGRT